MIIKIIDYYDNNGVRKIDVDAVPRIGEIIVERVDDIANAFKVIDVVQDISRPSGSRITVLVESFSYKYAGLLDEDM